MPSQMAPVHGLHFSQPPACACSPTYPFFCHEAAVVAPTESARASGQTCCIKRVSLMHCRILFYFVFGVFDSAGKFECEPYIHNKSACWWEQSGYVPFLLWPRQQPCTTSVSPVTFLW